MSGYCLTSMAVRALTQGRGEKEGWTDMEDDRESGLAFATAWAGALALCLLLWAAIGWAMLWMM